MGPALAPRIGAWSLQGQMPCRGTVSATLFLETESRQTRIEGRVQRGSGVRQGAGGDHDLPDARAKEIEGLPQALAQLFILYGELGARERFLGHKRLAVHLPKPRPNFLHGGDVPLDIGI